MREQGGSETAAGVLDPVPAVDLSARAQRRRIVEAMIDSCAEKTYAATTIADIVSRARVSRTTFYKRFPDKRACFDAALGHCVEQLQRTAVEALSRADPPPEAIHKATAATLDLLAAEPALAQLLMVEAIAVEPTAFGRYRNQLVPAVRALWEAHGERPRSHADPHLAFGRAQVLIFDKIAAGRAGEIPQLLPEIVYLALLPFAGHEVALAQSRRAKAGAGERAGAPG